MPQGVWHTLMQGDGVSLTLFGLLVAMSVLSWAVIGVKAFEAWRNRRAGQVFLQRFWAAPSLDEVDRNLPPANAREAFGELTAQALQARSHHRNQQAQTLHESGSAEDFVVRQLKTALDLQALRMESGQAALATVGATAPFVGLFGTVWGVYHALVGLGAGGPVSIDRVAGPVGEALIMTALGLAVAIPAVVAYNLFNRRQRVAMARLEAFAYELVNLVGTGRTLQAGSAGQGGAAPAGRVPKTTEPDRTTRRRPEVSGALASATSPGASA